MFDELKCIKIQKPYRGYCCSIPNPYITLDKLYKQGWWITEIFGSVAVIVQQTYKGVGVKNPPRFRVLCKHIELTNATPKALKQINKIRNEKWNIYKTYMLSGIWNGYKIRKDNTSRIK